MKTVEEVFDAAMSLMDELDASGAAQTNDTEEYANRTPAIMNTLIAEMRILSGERGFVPMLEGLDDALLNVDDNYAMGVMQYGLAAKLLLDENPAAASFYHQKYEELRERYFARMEAAIGVTENLYGGIEFGQFSRW